MHPRTRAGSTHHARPLLVVDFGTFPRPIVEVVARHRVSHLALSLARGRWDHAEWGQPLVGASSVGVQVEALLPTHTSHGRQMKAWGALRSDLGGIFCASINLINEQDTAVPHATRGPSLQRIRDWRRERGGGGGGELGAAVTLMRGSRPGEAVCGENLTPWAKLLPCASNAGLASLLNPLAIFDSRFHAFDVRIDAACLDGEACRRQRITLVQQLVVVFDVGRHSRTLGWTLGGLFGRLVAEACPVAASSAVSLGATEGGAARAMTIGEGVTLVVPGKAVWRLEELLHRDLGVEAFGREETSLAASNIVVDRILTGVGNEGGGVQVRWRNVHASRTITVSHLEVVPYYMRVFASTLAIMCASTRRPHAADVVLSPAVSRGLPSQIEVTVAVGPASTVVMDFEFERDLLRYTDFPFDPNRGFDLAGAHVTYLDGEAVGTVVTPKLLLTMPTPDFTMPYNVITITSTLIVLFYGTFFNLTYRRFYAKAPGDRGLAGRLARIFARTE